MKSEVDMYCVLTVFPCRAMPLNMGLLNVLHSRFVGQPTGLKLHVRDNGCDGNQSLTGRSALLCVSCHAQACKCCSICH